MEYLLILTYILLTFINTNLLFCYNTLFNL